MSNDVGKPLLPEMRMRQGEMDGLFAMFAALQEFDGVKPICGTGSKPSLTDTAICGWRRLR